MIASNSSSRQGVPRLPESSINFEYQATRCGSKWQHPCVQRTADWLANAHRTLDTAVFDAYNWPPTLTNPETLANLLALNHARATKE